MTSRQAASTFTIERLLGPLHGQESLTYTDISEDESEEEEETSADNDEASIIRQALISRHYVDCVRVSVCPCRSCLTGLTPRQPRPVPAFLTDQLLLPALQHQGFIVSFSELFS